MTYMTFKQRAISIGFTRSDGNFEVLATVRDDEHERNAKQFSAYVHGVAELTRRYYGFDEIEISENEDALAVRETPEDFEPCYVLETFAKAIKRGQTDA